MEFGYADVENRSTPQRSQRPKRVHTNETEYIYMLARWTKQGYDISKYPILKSLVAILRLQKWWRRLYHAISQNKDTSDNSSSFHLTMLHSIENVPEASIPLNTLHRLINRFHQDSTYKYTQRSRELWREIADANKAVRWNRIHQTFQYIEANTLPFNGPSVKYNPNSSTLSNSLSMYTTNEDASILKSERQQQQQSHESLLQSERQQQQQSHKSLLQSERQQQQQSHKSLLQSERQQQQQSHELLLQSERQQQQQSHASILNSGRQQQQSHESMLQSTQQEQNHKVNASNISPSHESIQFNKQFENTLFSTVSLHSNYQPIYSNEQIGRYQRFEHWCATRITAWWRMILTKRQLFYSHTIYRFSIYTTAACSIQGWIRQCQQHLGKRWIQILREDSQGKIWTFWDLWAYRIQRWYSNTMNHRMYMFLKRLIVRFEGDGNPKQILRTINPSEANMIDAATCIRIRFRLGGYIFPPKIYYKLFVSNPVCDINSFAPRQYCQTNSTKDKVTHRIPGQSSIQMKSATQMKASIQMQPSILMKPSIQMKASNQMNLNVDSTSQPQLYQYVRFENNGWRPINTKTIQETYEDPIFQATAKAKIRTNSNQIMSRYLRHHATLKATNLNSTLNRQNSTLDRQTLKKSTPNNRLAKKLKMRRRMQRMYAMATSGKDNQPYDTSMKSITSDIRNDTSMQQASDNNTDETEEDVDDLINWTDSLDYEQYVHDWRKLGSSGLLEPPSVYYQNPYDHTSTRTHLIRPWLTVSDQLVENKVDNIDDALIERLLSSPALHTPNNTKSFQASTSHPTTMTKNDTFSTTVFNHTQENEDIDALSTISNVNTTPRDLHNMKQITQTPPNVSRRNQIVEQTMDANLALGQQPSYRRSGFTPNFKSSSSTTDIDSTIYTLSRRNSMTTPNPTRTKNHMARAAQSILHSSSNSRNELNNGTRRVVGEATNRGLKSANDAVSPTSRLIHVNETIGRWLEDNDEHSIS